MNFRMPAIFRILLLALPFAAAAPAAHGEAPPVPGRDLPALYDVRDVAPDDVLNVRARPDARSAILDTLAHDARGIEIIATDESGRWGMIGLGESTGWVSLRYLARRPGQDPGTLPTPLHCFGTEPFWALAIGHAGEAGFSAPEEAERVLTLRWADTSANNGPAAFGLLLVSEGAESLEAHAVIRRRICHDGMSDGAYGLGIDAILSDAAGRSLISGCCSLAGR